MTSPLLGSTILVFPKIIIFLQLVNIKHGQVKKVISKEYIQDEKIKWWMHHQSHQLFGYTCNMIHFWNY